MAKQWRPAEVLTALQRLGFVDKPSVGDHVSLFKAVPDHPDGQVTIQTGIDMGQSPCSKHDVARIKRQTKLTADLWIRALDGDLTRHEYNEHLQSIPKGDLVLPFFKSKVEAAQRSESAPKPKSAAAKKRGQAQRGRRR